MQIVFQDPQSSLDPRRTVGSQIADGLEIHNIVPPAERRARVEALLAQVGLPPAHADRYPHEFSGGQRQRIGIARALATGPDFLVADEPVSALDVSVQAQVLAVLADLRARLGLALLFISHDLAGAQPVRAGGRDVPRPRDGNRASGAGVQCTAPSLYAGAAVSGAKP